MEAGDITCELDRRGFTWSHNTIRAAAAHFRKPTEPASPSASIAASEEDLDEESEEELLLVDEDLEEICPMPEAVEGEAEFGDVTASLPAMDPGQHCESKPSRPRGLAVLWALS